MDDKQRQAGFEVGEDEGPEVSIAYSGESNVVGVFADQVIVSHATGMITFFFYQMQIPPLASRETLLSLKEMPATCVSRVTLTPQLAENFHVALGSNLQRFKERSLALQKKTEEHPEGEES